MEFDIGNFKGKKMKDRKEKTKCKCKLSGSEFTEVIIQRRDINSKYIGSKLCLCLDSLNSFVRHTLYIYIYLYIDTR